MDKITSIILDAARSHERVSIPTPSSSDLERLLSTLKERCLGTLYLFTARENYLVVGVASRVWLAHIFRGPEEPLWLSNPAQNGRTRATFDFARTPTPIEARFTCRLPDAIASCRSFFLAPQELPSGNWIGEWTAPPSGAAPG